MEKSQQRHRTSPPPPILVEGVEEERLLLSQNWGRGLGGGGQPVSSTPETEQNIPDDIRRVMLAEVRRFVLQEVIPAAEACEHEDRYPHALVEKMKALGLFGAIIPRHYGGAQEHTTPHTPESEEAEARNPPTETLSPTRQQKGRRAGHAS